MVPDRSPGTSRAPGLDSHAKPGTIAKGSRFVGAQGARSQCSMHDAAPQHSSGNPVSSTPMTQRTPRLLDQVRQGLRDRDCSIDAKRSYVEWMRRSILWHDKHHPVTRARSGSTPSSPTLPSIPTSPPRLNNKLPPPPFSSRGVAETYAFGAACASWMKGASGTRGKHTPHRGLFEEANWI